MEGVNSRRIAKGGGWSWPSLRCAMNNTVKTPTVFDDGVGAASCAGGFLELSPSGDRHVARWRCRSSTAGA